MRSLFSAAIASALALSLWCCKDDKGSSGPSAAAPDPATASTPTSAPPSGQAGTLILGEIVGQIQPKEGAEASTAAGASVVGLARPEVTTSTDGDGKFTISNIAPGSLTLMVTSGGATGLTLAGSMDAKYGLKLDELVVTSGKSLDLGTKVMQETGSVKGTVNYYDNPNQIDLTGVEVFVPGTGYIAKTDANGQFTINGLPPGSYDLRIQQTGFAVLDLTDVKVLEAEQTDIGTKLLSLSNGPEGGISIVADLEATKLGKTIKIRKGNVVSINLTYDADAALMKISDEPSFLNKNWTPVAKTSSWQFDGDGPKALYVQYSDLNGLESSPYNVEFYIDQVSPDFSNVTILHGWQQIGSLNAILDVVASDNGTGIAEVMMSNVSDSFTNGETWQPYSSSTINWALAAGIDGTRTVYLKLRDFARNESVVLHDEIEKGAATIIKNMTYDFPITLHAAQNPYIAASTLTFYKPVTIEPGVTIDWQNYVADFRTYVVANGILGNTITFSNPSMYMHSADAAVSEKNVFSYVNFNNPGTLKLGGGLFDHCVFDGTASPYNRYVSLESADLLTIKNSSFVKWQTIYVMAGQNSVRLENNIADVQSWISQDSTAVNTLSKGNTITQKAGTNYSVFDIQRGSITSQGDTIVASSLGHGYYIHDGASSAPVAVTVKDVNLSGCVNAFYIAGIQLSKSMSVDGGTVSGCTRLAQNENFTGSAQMTVTNLTATNIDYVSHNQAGVNAAVSITHSDLSFKKALLYVAFLDASLSVTNSKLTCKNTGSGPCDLLYTWDANSAVYATLTLTNNRIICEGDTTNGCRGFTAKKGGAGGSAVITTSLGNNFWETGAGLKAMTPGNFSAELISDSPYNTEIRAYNLGYSGGQITGTGNWPPTVTPVVSNLGDLIGTIGPN